MKKKDQDTKLLSPDITSSKGFDLDKVKTTNVNILLNRVKLDQKKTLKKRITFTLTLVALISTLAIYFNLK